LEKRKLKASFLSPYKIVKPYFEGVSPATIEVHPTYPCNYNCEWCIDKELMDKGDNHDIKSMLTADGVREIIRFALERGTKGIIISGGGEPTLNKNTELLVKLADENGIAIGMFTNGSILDDEKIKAYVDHLSFLRFSFDDFNAENYSKTKGTTERMYDKVIDNIGKVVKYKKESGNTKCRIGIDFIFIPTNVDKIQSIYQKSLDLDVDYLQFCDCIIVGYKFTKRRNTIIQKGIEKIYEHKTANNVTMDVVYEPLQQENYISCKDCNLTEFLVQVGADGLVRPCAHCARRNDLAYGNIYEKSFSEIWDNRPKKLDTDYLFENCRYRQQNEIIHGLKNITHGDMV